MRFKATDEQVKQMTCLAFRASIPMGIGKLFYDASDSDKVTTSGVTIHTDSSGNKEVNIDYLNGRMVKLFCFQTDGIWELSEPREDYQSWASKYPTARSLVEAAGITEIIEG